MAITKSDHQNAPRTSRGIRPCKPGDIEQVTKLFLETFPHKKQHSENDLIKFFHEVYLENPWTDQRFPSLVFDNDGVIEGFLGVTPQKMQYRGASINVAVGSAFMVKSNSSGKRNPLTGASLLRQFLNGQQDLSVADNANDLTRHIWTSSGGSIAYPYSYIWTRPLQPLQTILGLEAIPSSFRKIAKPGAWLGDQLARKVPPIKPSKPDTRIRDISTDELIELMKILPGKTIMPDYEPDSLDWLIGKAEESVSEGRLAKRVVESPDGKPLGWYLYYQKRNAIGRVLQLAALPRSMDVVLDSLIYEAHREGLAALRGRAEPDYAHIFNKRFCVFQGRPWFLVHSSDPEIAAAFRDADVFFSGLEGELWIKTNA